MMPCIIKHNGHLFIGNDNGIFSLIFGGKQPEEIYEISELSSPDLLVFPTKTILVPAAMKIMDGIPLDEIGTRKEKVRRALSISPVIETHTIKGIVVHVDHYGNLITNISKILKPQK